MPNPVILEAIQPTIDALKDEMGVVALALELENVAAQTYQSNVATFMDPSLNAAIMSVGGVEARARGRPRRCARAGPGARRLPGHRQGGQGGHGRLNRPRPGSASAGRSS